jgi:hypothetical protein
MFMSRDTFNVYDAKAHFSRLIARKTVTRS